MDHELAHDGDSIEAGHDEAFYQRHHDIVVDAARLAGQYKEIFLRKWTQSYTSQTRRAPGRARMRDEFMHRLAAERRERGEDLRHWRERERDVGPIEIPDVPLALVQSVREELRRRGLSVAPPTLEEIREEARRRQDELQTTQHDDRHMSDEDLERYERMDRESELAGLSYFESCLIEIATECGRSQEDMTREVMEDLTPIVRERRYDPYYTADNLGGISVTGNTFPDLRFSAVLCKLASDADVSPAEISLVDAWNVWLDLWNDAERKAMETYDRMHARGWVEEEGDDLFGSDDDSSGFDQATTRPRKPGFDPKLTERRHDWMRTTEEIDADRQRVERLVDGEMPASLESTDGGGTKG
jgi:hypothetical protein